MAQAVCIKSFGCRTNQEEMMSLSSQLIESGHTIVESITAADIVIVNTCLVTAATESKTRRMISAISREKPGIKICVTGCLAQQSPLEIKKKLPVTWVVGNTQKSEIARILDQNSDGIFHDELNSPQKITIAKSIQTPFESKRTRFFLKIQEGCNFRCAYCIVPLVRGPSRSVDQDEILSVFEKAIDAGYKEIVITGTHIGQFDAPSSTVKNSLHMLVETLARKPGDFRIRLSSLDPRDISEEFLNLIATHPKICRHCHVCMQSLSPVILKKMNREIPDFDGFVNLLSRFHFAYPEVGIGGDFIVGFPSETDDQFLETVINVKKLGFCYGHVFRYSRRPQTSAAAMDGQIDESRKTERSQKLRSVLDESHSAFIEQAKKNIQTILIENLEPVSGLASNYLRVVVPKTEAVKNSWLQVRITAYDPLIGHCLAERVA